MMDKYDRHGNEYNPETLALSYGYDAALSEGSIKAPVFLTSTFQFKSAMEGKRFFEVAYGLRKQDPDEKLGLIYSRINNPNLQIFEERMAVWDKTEKGAVFASGMAAISTSVLAHLSPGDILISSKPVYGGTHYFFENILPRFGVKTYQVCIRDNMTEAFEECVKENNIDPEKVKMVYLETPSNPSIRMVDIKQVSDYCKGPLKGALLAVDNTFLGPVFQRPAEQGADLIIYSATKFIGGHSDLVAGVVTGSLEHLGPIIEHRTIFGTMANPFTGWMLLRSLETLSVRMRRQAKSATKMAKLLMEHPLVENVYHPSIYTGEQKRIYEAQCSGPGSLISFDVKGDEAVAFKLLDSFEIARLAVSLGGTETLVEHPMAMTHSDVPKHELEAMGVTESTIRISVGIEHFDDLENDMLNALDAIK